MRACVRVLFVYLYQYSCICKSGVQISSIDVKNALISCYIALKSSSLNTHTHTHTQTCHAFMDVALHGQLHISTEYITISIREIQANQEEYKVMTVKNTSIFVRHRPRMSAGTAGLLTRSYHSKHTYA